MWPGIDGGRNANEMKRLPLLETYNFHPWWELKSPQRAGGRMTAATAPLAQAGRAGTGGKSPPAKAEKPARVPRAAGGNPWPGRPKERRFRKAPPRRTADRTPRAHGQGQQHSGWKASPWARRFPAQAGRAWRGAWAPDAGQRAHQEIRRPAQSGLQGSNGGTKRSSTGDEGRSAEQQEAPDAKVPWKCARPAAAAPADEAVSAGADRTAHVLRKEGHDTVGADGNVSPH